MYSEKDPDDYPGTHTQKVQAALDAQGFIRLKRAYTIASSLTIRGDTHVVGDPGAKLEWVGAANGNIIQDSSVHTSTDVNRNIVLENFEIDGRDVVDGSNTQIAINFYRTGNVTIRGLTVHGVGGSGIRWGLSQTDTMNVLVENCVVYDCRAGDGIQGAGEKIVVRNNKIGFKGSATSNFGDTGIALLTDFSDVTNPSQSYPNNVLIISNTIVGNYDDSGAYEGIGSQIQTGIAFGPFDVGFAANIRVADNTISNCHLNLWAIVMDDVSVIRNRFGPHAATDTGGVRFDGVTNVRVRDNNIYLAFAGSGLDYSGILLAAQRNTYGASKFDSDVSKFDVSGNRITSSVAAQGIRATFEQINNSPSYTSKLTSGKIENNSFHGVSTPIALAPQIGTTPNVCDDVVIRGNKVDVAATSLVMTGGNASQYVSTRVFDNPVPGTVPPVAGTGVDDLVIQHKAFAKASAPSGSPVTVLTLPSAGYYRVDMNAFVKAASSTFSATATITVNGGVARITSQSDGANLALTLSGLNVQANQTTGAMNDIYATGTYS